MFTIQMRQLYGRHLKSPFKSLEEDDSKKSDFEYDAQRGIKSLSNFHKHSHSFNSFIFSAQHFPFNNCFVVTCRKYPKTVGSTINTWLRAATNTRIWSATIDSWILSTTTCIFFNFWLFSTTTSGSILTWSN